MTPPTIMPRPRARLAPLSVGAASSPPAPPADDLLAQVLERLRGYVLASRVEIAARIANFHAAAHPDDDAHDLVAAWRAIEVAEAIAAMVGGRGRRLSSSTVDALRAEITRQYAKAAEHLEASGIRKADDAFPPRAH